MNSSRLFFSAILRVFANKGLCTKVFVAIPFNANAQVWSIFSNVEFNPY